MTQRKNFSQYNYLYTIYIQQTLGMCYYERKYLDIIRLGKFTEKFPLMKSLGRRSDFKNYPSEEYQQSGYKLVVYTLG